MTPPMSMTPTIQTNYNQLKSYYNQTLNINPDLVQTSNDVPTPIECIEEMLDKLPEEVWKNPNYKWLDPCCGCGNFFLVVVQRLLVYHSLEHILSNMLYFNDVNRNRLEIVEQVFGIEGISLNLTQQDFLEYSYPDNENENTLFDVILANPPYAKLLPNGKRASKNHNLIGSFLKQSFRLLKPNGYLLYITPDNWMSLADRNTLIQDLTQKQILHLNIHLSKRYFKKIGSSFTYYLIHNRPHYKDIQIEGIYKGQPYQSQVSSEPRSYIPLYYTRVVQSILHKTLDLPLDTHPRFGVETSSDLHKYTKRHLIQNEQSPEYPYKLIHTPTQTVWAKRPHIYSEGYKVFISTTSYYKVFIDQCGMTQSIAFIRCPNKETAEHIQHLLTHPLYRFLNNICRWGNFNNIRILQKFPIAPHYDQVYTHFGLTEEEINTF
jgi:ubiquinone/menaquinone biosynthesis C-methylase UbiE